MANRGETVIPPATGETRMGGSQVGVQGLYYIRSQGGASNGAILALDGISSGNVVTTWYLFVTSAGVLRISSTLPTNTETGGSAV